MPLCRTSDRECETGRADPTRADIDLNLKASIEDPWVYSWKRNEELGDAPEQFNIRFPVVVLDAKSVSLPRSNLCNGGS